MKPVTIAVLAVGAYLLYQGYEMAAGTGTMQIIFSGLNINGPLNYTATLTIQNISNVPITVNSMTGNILINGNQLASISAFGTAGQPAVTVPPNGQTQVNVNVLPSLLSLPGDVAQLLSGGGQSVDFTAAGNANVSGLIIPFSVDKVVSVP
jgi:Late embryogenesis abundant protein